MDRVNILGVNVDMVTISEATDKILDFLNEDRLHSVYTPNSEIIMEAYRNQDFNEILNAADLLTADGIGVVYAAKYLKKPIKERAAGYDVAKLLLQKISYTDHKLFLFGGKPGVGDLAKKNMQKDYPGLNIVGVRNGYFTDDEEEEIINEINASGADLLFVCLGAPRQEKWIHKNKDKLKVKVAMGVGGSIDVFAGTVQRAPDFFCKTGLEWFYRLMKEPWRAKRMMDLPRFAMTVVKEGKKHKQD